MPVFTVRMVRKNARLLSSIGGTYRRPTDRSKSTLVKTAFGVILKSEFPPKLEQFDPNHPIKAGMPGWSGAGRFARAYGSQRDEGCICLEVPVHHDCCSRAWPENGHPGVSAGARQDKRHPHSIHQACIDQVAEQRPIVVPLIRRLNHHHGVQHFCGIDEERGARNAAPVVQARRARYR